VDDLPARDPDGHIDRLAGLVQRRSLLARLARPMIVVMRRVVSQSPPEVSFTVDQQVIEALAPQRPRIPLRKQFARGERAGVLMTRTPLPARTSPDAAVTVAVAVPDQEPEPGGPLAEVDEEVTGLLGGPAPVGCAVTPGMCARRVPVSITNKTCRRLRNTVSTCKKSHARIPDA
jgi:hypothetical protein